jgi:aldose 1-epimerase
MSLETISLRDPNTGAAAKILPGFGFNCYSFCPQPAGEPIEVLWSHPNFASGSERPSHSGVPLLFPFAGRIRGMSYAFQGKTYTLQTLDDHRGNAIHGFVLNRPWRVAHASATRVVGEFRASREDPKILEQWPADFEITVSYELAGNTLKSEIRITNPDDKPLPFGFGTHPYFRVPLGPGGDAAQCRVTVPVSEYWELVDMLPSGKQLKADGPRGLAAGMKFADTKLDDVFTGLSPAGGPYRATIEDPHLGRKLTVEFDKLFRECVVYNPPHREAICIEPYTCVPDPFTLAAKGIETGLRVLAPGESVTGRVDVRLD